MGTEGNMGTEGGFDGAKVALFLGDKLAVILRDDLPGLSFAGHWDLPGGGRERHETPFECVARECEEELGLVLRQQNMVWSRAFSNAVTGKGNVWFFVAKLPVDAVEQVRFGSEGQCWSMMSTQGYLSHPKAVPAFQGRLRMWMEL
jgi:8-oxo-dGTP diphosphatase